MPRSPSKDTEIVRSGPFCVNRWDRPRDDPAAERSGVRPERALEANTPTSRAKRESRSFLEPTQRAEA